MNQWHGEDLFRLPTEAEWEYAARAGALSRYYFGEKLAELDAHAWYLETSSGESVAPVGAKDPNPWGLFDMYGNAWEWVHDWYASDYYASSAAMDPSGPASGTERLIRGGGYRSGADDQRSARRLSLSPSTRFEEVGARLLMGSPILRIRPELSTSPLELVAGNLETELDLQLTNSGTGLLEWTVKEEEPWMEISFAQGSTADDGILTGQGPAILRVQLYASSGTGEVLSGIIEISSTGGGAEIPVLVHRPILMAGIDNDETLQANLPGGATMDFVWIEPGTFAMGATLEEGGFSSESPRHVVEISRGFYMGKYEVTQEQWEAVRGSSPWLSEGGIDHGPDFPATYVNWIDAQNFIHQMNEDLGETVYRLPTEAEWEYAVRAGTSTTWFAAAEELQDYAWFGAVVDAPQPVGTKLSNPWGLHDMHGNVWEWVQDWYADDYYALSPTVDPTGPAAGKQRVMRGGDYRMAPRGLRAARRFSASPSAPRVSISGFRLVLDRSIPQPQISPENLAVNGRPQESEFTLSNAGSGELAWTITEQAPWLVVSSRAGDTGDTGSLSGSGDADFTVHTSGSGQPEGEWLEQIQITTNGGDLALAVTMRVREAIEVPLPGGASMVFVWIDPGVFTMGSPQGEEGRYTDEGPAHEVELSQGFYFGQYEITQEQWTSAMGTSPWQGQDLVREGANSPATYISWQDVHELIRRLNDFAGETMYRLPTEAEWEFSARAGGQDRWSFGGEVTDLDENAWHQTNAWNLIKQAPEVGGRLPNSWDLFDMHGNVWEWVQDLYQANYYELDERLDPQGPGEGEFRVIRGGAFFDLVRDLRSARRAGYLTERGFGPGVGARLVRIRR